MLLCPDDADLFFRVNRLLMEYANERLKVLPECFKSHDEFVRIPPERRIELHRALYARPDLIESFADENPSLLSEEDLDLVRSWRHGIAAKFIILRQLQKHAIFLSTEGPPTAYGVLALTDTFDELVRLPLPLMVETTLLPFRDKIICDGLVSSFNISLGPGIRRGLNESYAETKRLAGIVTSLPAGQAAPGKARPAVSMPNAPAALRRQPSKARNPFRGRWRIESMEQPDEDFIHENEESYFEFGRDGRGEFHFGDVHCEMDCRLGTRDGRKAVEFTFEGGIGADAATGRGWAVLHGTSLEGRLFFHFGDDSSFTAVKVTQRVAGVRRKG